MVIVLETSLLHGRADPDAASEIKPLLTLAKQVRAAVKIPEPCLIELRDGHRQNIQLASSELEKVRRNMARLRIRLEIPPIDEVAELAAYEERLQRFLESHYIEKIPFVDPFPDPKTLFGDAVKKQSPFDRTGNNFRDAVICLSVQQFARSVEPPILLVTGDGGFQVVLRGDEGFEVLKIEDAKKRLETQFSAKELARRLKRYKQIETALRKQFDKISQMAQQRVEFSVREWIEPGIRLISIDKFVASGVQEVDFAEASGTTLPFTAWIEGKLHCTVRGTPIVLRSTEVSFALQGPTKVGQSTPPVEGFSSSMEESVPAYLIPSSSANPFIQPVREALYDVTLTLEGNATLNAKRDVEKIDYTSIYEKNPGYFLTADHD